MLSTRNSRLQFHVPVLNADGVLNLAPALLLQILRLLPHEPLEILQTRHPSLLARLRPRFHQPLIKLLHLFRLVFRIRKRQSKISSVPHLRSARRRIRSCVRNCRRRRHAHVLRSHLYCSLCRNPRAHRIFRGLALSLAFDGFCRRAVMMLRRSGFFLDQLLPPHVLILRVRRSQIAIAESLPRRKLSRPVRVALQIRLQPPLRIRRRPRTPAAEILLKFYFQRADVPLDLSEFFVNSCHNFSAASRRASSSTSLPAARACGRHPGACIPSLECPIGGVNVTLRLYVAKGNAPPQAFDCQPLSHCVQMP